MSLQETTTTQEQVLRKEHPTPGHSLGIAPATYSESDPFKITIDIGRKPEIEKEDAMSIMGLGSISLHALVPYLARIGLGPNVRCPKHNKKVTPAVIQTILEEPRQLRARSNGILLSAGKVRMKPGNTTVEISFTDPELHGIGNGGNLGFFAARKAAVLGALAPDNPERRQVESIKHPAQLPPFEAKYSAEIDHWLKKCPARVSVEVIYPTDKPNKRQLLAAVHARNVNVEQTNVALDHYVQVYGDLIDTLPDEINDRINWKPNETMHARGHEIDTRDVLMLADLLLYAAHSHGAFKKLAVNDMRDAWVKPSLSLYDNKHKVTKAYRKVKEELSVQTDAGFEPSTNKAFLSALALIPDVMKLHDWLTANFIGLYQKSGRQMRGKNGLAQLDIAPPSSPYLTTFFQEEMAQTLRGALPTLILPLLFSLVPLTKMVGGSLTWKQDPVLFFETYVADYIQGDYMDEICKRTLIKDDAGQRVFSIRHLQAVNNHDFWSLVEAEIKGIINQNA